MRPPANRSGRVNASAPVGTAPVEAMANVSDEASGTAKSIAAAQPGDPSARPSEPLSVAITGMSVPAPNAHAAYVQFVMESSAPVAPSYR